MSLYLGENLISGINTPIQGRAIGQIIQSTIPLNDAGLHLLDGSTLNGEGVYKDFYEYILNGNENAIKFKGDLTNNNGVVSGFTSYRCLQLNGPTARVDNSEYVVKFTTGSDITTSQAIIASEHWICLDIGITSGKLSTWNWETGSAVVLNSVSANTTYWVKIVCSGTSRTFSISTDGTSYTQMATYTDTSLNSTTMNEDYDFVLGRYSHAEEHPFLGSIDLTGSYIKQNNEFIWDGSNYTIMPMHLNTKANYNWHIATYDICGQYILDPTNKTITLPKITGILEGVVQSSKSNKVIAAGLPNITGSISNIRSSAGANTSASGALIRRATTEWPNSCSQTTDRTYYEGINFDASNSNSIYGNSTTVQPQTTTVYYYVVIATLTKTIIEVDIDNVVTDLNDKLDKVSTSYSTIIRGNSGSPYNAKFTTVAIGTVPSTATYPAALKILDNNDNNLGTLEYELENDGWYGIGIVAKKWNENNYDAQIKTGYNANGKPCFRFPKCTTQATTTSTAANDIVAVIVENYKNGASWYRVWSDGWIEQGGNVTGVAYNSSTYNVTFLKSFTTTNYVAFACISSVHAHNVEVAWVTDRAKTKMIVRTGWQSGSQTAAADWYACGY